VESSEANVASWLGRPDPDRVALIDDERSLTYGALDDRCARLAGVLAAAGIGRGDRVAVLLGNHASYLEAVFACARLGAIVVPLNNRLAPPELDVQLRDCSAVGLLAEAELAEKVPAPPRFVLAADAYEDAIAAAPAQPVAEVSPDDPLMILYTSGTTGRPKGALLPHRKTLYNSLNAEIFFRLTPEDRVLVALPLFHSFGLNILSLPMLHVGGRVILQRRFDPERAWKTCAEEGVSFFGAVPTMFQRLLEAFPEKRPPSLRFLFTAGAAIPVATIRAYERRGVVLKQGFGQTETSILCCLSEEDAIRKAGSVGRPVHHAELRCIEPESGHDVAPGETGEIVVRGPITMLGYWEHPEGSQETFQGGWLHTGDLATVDAEGFYTLVGRAHEMFISGGENVYPAEIEAVYEHHPEVAEIAVRGVPDERWGEVGRAWVVPSPGAQPDPEGLAAWGRERLASFKIPVQFQVVSELPRTVTGKVQKHLLPEIA